MLCAYLYPQADVNLAPHAAHVGLYSAVMSSFLGVFLFIKICQKINRRHKLTLVHMQRFSYQRTVLKHFLIKTLTCEKAQALFFLWEKFYRHTCPMRFVISLLSKKVCAVSAGLQNKVAFSVPLALWLHSLNENFQKLITEKPSSSHCHYGGRGDGACSYSLGSCREQVSDTLSHSPALIVQKMWFVPQLHFLGKVVFAVGGVTVAWIALLFNHPATLACVCVYVYVRVCVWVCAHSHVSLQFVCVCLSVCLKSFAHILFVLHQ